MPTDELRAAWIQTYTGRAFHPFDPKPSEVCIEDIAHALANTCRFNGHTREFYSVAQHSVLVSSVVPREHALAGLLHDAAEAYVGDIVRPIKRLFPAFAEVEATVHAAIAKHFGISAEIPTCVHEADNRVLMTEKRDLLVAGLKQWNETAAPLVQRIHPIGPEHAERLFLEIFELLQSGGG